MTETAADIKSIFADALDRVTPKDRADYLDTACRGDTSLRMKVESLLQAHAEADDVLDAPIVGLGMMPEGADLSEGPGTVVGCYKLLEKIGEGGMAVVYMAEQQEPIRRKVALKIIKLGMDTKQVIARFEAERQALAMMDHPNIAKVFDAGGTEAGRPYFAMELVSGVSITKYCDENHLGTKARLSLFMQVCAAVQHAHQKGIIHRDIKPANVMVTMCDGIPVPKVIDFGIAKATDQRLTEKTLFTRYAHITGTPAYMSPEQAELSDVDIDTRSDIYSLGVLLYELLIGTTPFSEEELREAGYLGMHRVIREEEPTKPSTKLSTLGAALTEVAQRREVTPDALRRLIRGDLDWIVMKSLEKDRARRYETASAFLEDIKRHLHHEPVQAGAPSTWYRTKKFLQRHSTLVVATAVVLVVALTGLLFSTLMYIRADRARSETELVSDFFTDDFLSAIYPEKAKGQEVTVRYILDNAVKDIDKKLKNSPLSEAKVRETIGLAYHTLGDYEATEPHLQRALQIRREHLGNDDPATLASLSQLGRLYTLQGRYEKAETVLKNALVARIRVLGEDHPDTLESMGSLGQLHVFRSNYSDAHPLLAKVQQIGKRVLGEEHLVVLNAMLCHTYLFAYSHQPGLGYPLANRGLEISRRVLGEEHEITLKFMSMLANNYKDRKEYDEARGLFARTFEISQRILGHPLTIDVMSRLGDLHRIEGRYEEAAPLVTNAAELSRRILGWGHVWTLLCAMRLSNLYEVQEQYDEMETTVCEALEFGCPLQGNRQLTGWFQWKLRQHTTGRSSVAREHYDAGEYGDAIRTLIRQVKLRRLLPSDEAELPPSEVALLAMALHRLGRNQEARSELYQLRRMFDQGEYTHEEQHLCEAEQVFVTDGSGVYQAWGSIEDRELKEASGIIEGLRARSSNNDLNGNIQSLTDALARAYCLRGRRAESRGEYAEAIADYESSLRGNAGFARAHDRLACMLSTRQADEVRDGARAVKHAIQACELTEWKNAACLTTLAAAYAETGDFGSAVEYQRQAIELLSRNGGQGSLEHYETRLHLYESGKPYHRSMVASWPCDRPDGKIVYDASGNGLNGKLVGDAHLVEDVDRPGKVLLLDGEADWVDCGNDMRLSIVSEITVACWVKVHKFDKSRQTIISKGNHAWRLSRKDGGDGVEFECSGLIVLDEADGTVQGSANVNDARWHHIAGVYDGTRTRLYVDGKLNVSSEASGTINTNSCKVLIGENEEERTSQGHDRSFNGLLDDVRIYDYALTEAEIRALYGGEETGAREKVTTDSQR